MNFNEWAKVNPTKSLNDYYKEQELEANLQKTQVFVKKDISANPIWGVLNIVLSLFIGGIAIFVYMKYK
jgi:hypothetical protein